MTDEEIKPDLSDEPYGPHERNVLDILHIGITLAHILLLFQIK